MSDNRTEHVLGCIETGQKRIGSYPYSGKKEGLMSLYREDFLKIIRLCNLARKLRYMKVNLIDNKAELCFITQTSYNMNGGNQNGCRYL